MQTAELGSLWHELVAGCCRVVDGFFTDERCYLVISRRNPAANQIEERRLRILQAVLRGTPQNNVAIDLALAPSTVALHCRIGLQSLGVSGKPSRVHPLLMLAAIVAGDGGIAVAKASSFAIDDLQLRVVKAVRPDRHLARVLPAAELAVIRRLIEGRSYAAIAAERGTSARTIANQVTAVFRRLRVSGRNELLLRLLLDEGLLVPNGSVVSAPPPARRAIECQESWGETRRSA